ncbi:MAG: phosphoglucosamine mutase [Candidatus Izemoplasmatales bacterium]
MKYFGTDGIRGKAYDFITEEMSFRVGKSLHLFPSKTNKIIIARDTRISSEMIVENIKKGALLAGIDVCDIGVYATPILAFASIQNDCFGVMVTASHNPFFDNGIKIFNRGQKSLTEDELLIEAVIDNDIDLSGVLPGKEITIPTILDEYYQLFKPFDMTLNLNIGLDLANGATIKSALKTLPNFVERYSVIGNEPNGININAECGSTHLDKLQSLVLENKLDLGIAFDGDGDRILVVDDEGEIIDGDLLIYIMAKYLKSQQLLNKNIVVLSKMSNLGIIKALSDLGIRVVQTDVGDKYIFKALDEEEATLGGENSGHIINKVLLKTGDGVLNAWYLLKILNYYQTKLSCLKKEVNYYPDKLVNIKNIDKNIASDPKIIELVKHYQNVLSSDGKVLVRASGTEPLIRVSVSAKTNELVDEIINDIVNKIKNKEKGE